MHSHSGLAAPILRLQWQLAAYVLRRKLAGFVGLLKGGYNPDQPRVPAGSADGGQWTSEGGVSGSSGSSGKSGGHHYVSRSVYEKLPLQPETKKVFDQATTVKLKAGPHLWSSPHFDYNAAVSKKFDAFLAQNDIRPEDMTPDQARKFVDLIKTSREPAIRNFNMRIYMREIRFWLFRMPRGSE